MSHPPDTSISAHIGGANQSSVRAHNERLVLTLVRRHGSLAKSEIARRSGMSPQTVSVIMRALEADGLLLRGEPQRGKVGQPSVPMRLNPEGAFSIGLKIGRRSAELVLVDFLGTQRVSVDKTFSYPMPDALMDFVESSIGRLRESLSAVQHSRIAGIGLSMPFELWNWSDKVGAPAGEMDAWREYDFKTKLEKLTGLPTLLQNDATSACSAELVFGQGVQLADFIYLFVGTFIGGGIVLNHSLFAGRTGYAGALGPMPVTAPSGEITPLIDHASIYSLETLLQSHNQDCSPLWESPDDWSMLGDVLDQWIESTGHYLAIAIISACSVIDFQAAVIDGALPANVKKRLVRAIDAEIDKLDLQGLNRPRLYEGVVGRGARSLGAASLPLSSRYLFDPHNLFTDVE